ncbi:hypothetical protein NTGM5_10028 [Candidatus Nitrotoga sp. M5]|nr:hypothetical protein NTGM5_10028 [Candidatus Nitrotoga sp. M5]
MTIVRLLFVSIGQPPISAHGIKHMEQDGKDTTPGVLFFNADNQQKRPLPIRFL